MTVREKRSEKLRRLGVGCPITRRDFIDGIAVTAAVASGDLLSTAHIRCCMRGTPGR
jgi:hypothetical protein